MSFRLFLDDDGKARLNDAGVPLYIQEGASDPTPIDVNALHDQVRKVGGEAAGHRKDKETLTGRLESLHKSLEDVRIESETLRREKDGVIHDLLVRSAFAASAYLREKTVLPPEFAYASFGPHFSVEYVDGTPTAIARDYEGKVIENTAGKPASAEEALKVLVERHPRRDALLRAPAPRGGSGSIPARAGKSAPMSRAKLTTTEAKAAYIAEHGLAAFKRLPVT